MSNTGVIGMGHVGKITAKALRPLGNVTTYDHATDAEYPSEAFRNCNFVVICVDTPSREDGSVDLSNVHEAVRRVPCDLLMLRSTVPPGTTAALAESSGKTICFWPEYIGESAFSGSSWESFSSTDPFMVIGGNQGARRQLIDALLPSIGPAVRIFQCTSGEAELIKYMENTYFAAKVVFVNEFRILCERLMLDWHTVREGWLLDPRVERDHSVAFEMLPGFGGKCLPKDLDGILAFASTMGIDLPFLTAVRQVNAGLKSKD